MQLIKFMLIFNSPISENISVLISKKAFVFHCSQFVLKTIFVFNFIAELKSSS